MTLMSHEAWRFLAENRIHPHRQASLATLAALVDSAAAEELLGVITGGDRQHRDVANSVLATAVHTGRVSVDDRFRQRWAEAVVEGWRPELERWRIEASQEALHFVYYSFISALPRGVAYSLVV